MGIIANAKALKNVQTIKNGGKADFTYSQIVNLIINLPDANRNLDKRTFDELYSLYKKYNSAKTPYYVDYNGYLDLCMEVINDFNTIAPYELYSGGNEFEVKKMMENIEEDRMQLYEEIKDSFDNNVDKAEAIISFLLDEIDEFVNNGDYKLVLKASKYHERSNEQNYGTAEVLIMAAIIASSYTLRYIYSNQNDLITKYKYSIFERTNRNNEAFSILEMMFSFQEERIEDYINFTLEQYINRPNNWSHNYAYSMASVTANAILFPASTTIKQAFNKESHFEFIFDNDSADDDFTKNYFLLRDFLSEIDNKLYDTFPELTEDEYDNYEWNLDYDTFFDELDNETEDESVNQIEGEDDPEEYESDFDGRSYETVTYEKEQPDLNLARYLWDQITDYLENKGLDYSTEASSGSVYFTRIGLESKLKKADCRVDFDESGYTVYAFSEFDADLDQVDEMLKYLHLANYNMIRCNFEIDLDNGIIRVKSRYDVYYAPNLTDEYIQESLNAPVNVLDEYGNGIVALSLGFSNAEDEISKVENDVDYEELTVGGFKYIDEDIPF